MDKSSDNCDVQVTIVLPSKTFHISKKLICSKIPYFDEMFSSGLKESNENRVELNLDERIFRQIIFYLKGSLLINSKDVISLYDMADFLLIDDLKDECSIYFTKLLNEFNIDQIADLLNQVTETSKLLNSKTMDSFFCRHFLEVVASKSFVHYTCKVLDRILELDLWIDSEFQVFEAIMEWAEYDIDSRKQHLPHLLKHIRWTCVDTKDLQKIKSNNLVKQLENFDELLLHDKQTKSRIVENVIVAIFYSENSSKQRVLHLYYYAGDETWHPLNNFTEDLDLCKHVIGTQNLIIDMFYDYGRQLVRLDLTNSTFCHLEPYEYLNKLLSKEKYPRAGKYCLQDGSFCHNQNDKWSDYNEMENTKVSTFILSKGKLLFMQAKSDHYYDTVCFCWFKRYSSNIEPSREHHVPITLFNGNVCVHSKSGDEHLTCLDISSQSKSIISLPEYEFPYSAVSSSSMSLAGNETTLMIADKNTKKFYVYTNEKKDWDQFGIFDKKNLEAITSLRIPK